MFQKQMQQQMQQQMEAEAGGSEAMSRDGGGSSSSAGGEDGMTAMQKLQRFMTSGEGAAKVSADCCALLICMY